MKLMNAIIACVFMMFSLNSQATLIFSNLSFTDSSFTFTVDGDLSGYATPSIYPNQFNIGYSPSLYIGGVQTNSWSGNVFDGVTPHETGYTGDWDSPPDYTWTHMSGPNCSTCTEALPT